MHRHISVIHIVSTHIQDNVLIFAQNYQLYEILIIWFFGVLLEFPKCPFIFKDIYIYLEISLQKIQFCENRPSKFWFTLLDIVNNNTIKLLSKMYGLCLIP